MSRAFNRLRRYKLSAEDLGHAIELSADRIFEFRCPKTGLP